MKEITLLSPYPWAIAICLYPSSFGPFDGAVVPKGIYKWM